MKKIASILLALVMALSLVATAFAAEGDTYEIYQIFTGDYSDGVLSNVKWGQNGKGYSAEANADLSVAEAILTELTGLNSAEKTDKEKLAVIEKHADLTTKPYKTGTATTYEGLPNGYYLVKNVDGSQDGENEFYTLFVVKVVDNKLEFSPKGSVPTVGKEVVDNDANIGDTVTFILTATMPSNIDEYDTYKVIFHDTLSSGLTYVSITSVVVNGKTLTADDYTADHESGELTVTIADVVKYDVTKDSTVVVTYTATLNSGAIIGSAGNPNTVYLEYSNNPNTGGEGDTGYTPPEEVKVYTWKIPVFKYTGTNTPLAGAGFTLYDEGVAVKLTKVGDSNVYKVDPNGTVTEITTGSGGRFEIEGLEQGTYVLKETNTPAGYNTCDDVTVVIGANGTLTQDGDATTEVSIQNNAGTVLPETGGVGTTIFYIVGGILVLAAVVLLVTKKRMQNNG